MGLLVQPAMRLPSPARQAIHDSQPGYSDGLNSVANDFALMPTQMRRSDNVRLVDIGAATKRGGLQRTAAALASATLRGGYTWQQSASTRYLLAMCSGSLFKATYGAFPLTWTSLGGAFTSTAVPTFAAFRDTSANVVYVATGGALQKWDGTTRTSLASPPHVTGVTVYHDRLWGWGVSGSEDSLYYSNLSNALSSIGGDSLGVGASSGGSIIIRTFGQQEIVACAPVNTSLLIFHRIGISRLTGYGQVDILATPDAVTADVGLIGAKALTVYDNLAYFVSNRGVYVGNEASVLPVGTPEKPDPVLPKLRTLSAANLALVTCTYNAATREVWIALPGIGIYLYHTILKSWSGPFVDGYLSPDTSALWQGYDASDQPVLLRGDQSGYVTLCDAAGFFKDNVAAAGTGGTTYNAVIQCHRMFSEDPTRADSYRWAELLCTPAGSASINVAWSTLTSSNSFQLVLNSGNTTWGATGSQWGQGTWGVGGQAPFYIPLDGTGPFIDLTITDSGQGASQYASVSIDGFAYGRR